MFGFMKDIYEQIKFGFFRRPIRVRLTGIISLVHPLKNGDESEYKIAALCNVSASGMAIESYEDYSVGSEIVVRYKLPWRSTFINGKFVRKRSIGGTKIYGIKFLNPHLDKDKIKRLLLFCYVGIEKAKKQKGEEHVT